MPLSLEQLEDLTLPSAAVFTDKPDYAPGQSALMTATGFQVGETVRLNVDLIAPAPGQSFSPWFVTDGGLGDLDGVANGTIQTSWLVNDQCEGATLLLTVTGQASGLTAQMTFTDNAPVTSAVAATPVLANVPPVITANVSEIGNPGSNIAAAEFFIGTVGESGTGTPMAASDGNFDSRTENATQTLTQAKFSTLTDGLHTIYVHGEDARGNWGPFASATFTKDTVAPAVSVTVPPPVVPVGTSLTITGTSADAGSGVSGVQVTITGPGGVVLAQGSATNTGTAFSTWSFAYTASQPGNQSVVATATDGAGNSAASSAAGFFVNAPPVLTSPGDRTLNEQTPIAFTLSAADADGDLLTYSIVSGAQTGMTLTAGGAFSWTPTEAQDGSYSVTFGVADNHGASDQKMITITVNEVNTAPSLTVPASITGEIKTTPVTFTATATDPDTINPGAVPNTLTFGLVGSTYGATINSTTGVFTWTPTQDQDGPFNFTVSVTDKGSFGLPDAQALTTTGVVTITTVPAGIDANGNLLVVGHSAGEITLVDATNPAAATVTIDGSTFGPFAIPAAGHIVIHAFDGGNTITVRGGVSSNVTTGAGNDTIVADSLSAGTMTVDGGAGVNTLIVNASAGPDTVGVTNTQVLVTGGPTVNYANVQTLSLNTGAGSDAMTVNASGAGLPGQINVNTGADDDQISVNLGSEIATTVNVDGGTHAAGDSMTVNGTAGSDVIALNGSTLTSGPITVNLANIGNLTVAAGGGPDTINATGTTLTGKLTLDGGDDTDAITLGAINVGQLSATAESIAVAGPVTSSAGGMSLTATGGTLTVTGTTISAVGGDITLVAAAVSIANTAAFQATGVITLNASSASLAGVNFGATSNLSFANQNGNVDLSGADFGSLTNIGAATTINLSGADFASLTNSATSASINLNGADFSSLTNSGDGAHITIDVAGADFGSLTNTGINVQINLAGADFTSLTNSGTGTAISLSGADFGSLTNSGTAATISFNGANFSSLTNSGTGTAISLSGADFSSLVNSAGSTTINISGATFQTLINGDAAQVAQIAASGADFSSLTDTAGHAIINVKGANFDTLVNAGSYTSIVLTGADFTTLVNGGGANNTSVAIDVTEADFGSLYDYASATQINITGANFPTSSDGVVNISPSAANFDTLVTAGSGTTINVNGANFDTLVNSGSATITLNGADFDTLMNSGTGTAVSLAGADFNTLQNSGASTAINISGVDFASLINSGTGASIAVSGSTFQFVQNDGDNAAMVLSSGGSGSSTVANNGNNTSVTYTGGSGDDVFVNDARGDTSHGNNVSLNVNLGAGNDRYVIGGTGVTGTLTGGTGDHTYLFVAGPTGDLTIQEPANTDTDTLDFSNLTTGPVNIDLTVTAKQVVAPGLSLKLSSATGIANVIGTQFGDTIRGNARNNVLLGAELPDDRIGLGPAWNGRTQTVFLDFDSKTQPTDHQYSAAERNANQSRLEADYHGPNATSDPSTWWFHVAFTQTMPAGVQNVDYVTVYFNQPRAGSGGDGPAGVGGDSSEIDFGNRNFGGWASVDVKTTDPVTHQVTTLIGGVGQPPEYNSANTADQSWTNDNWVRASSWIAAHEIGHLMGLRHADSFGPIGYGIHTPPGINGFFISPPFNGPSAAFETDFHLIATPALTGFTLNDLVGDTFFSEREAVKLAYDQAATVTPDGNLLAAEQAAAHASLTVAGSQALTFASLTVPDTLTRGLNSNKQFVVGAVDVLGTIGTVGEKDVYRIAGRKGDLLNMQVMSEALNRYAGQAIDAVLTVYDSSGNVVATSDDEFEDHDPNIIDLRLTKDDTYYLEVKTSGTTAHDGLNPTGEYELFAYRFSTANRTDGSDTLEGRGGNNILAGGMGNDTYVFNGVNLGSDLIQEDVRYEAQNGTVGSRDPHDKLDFSGFGAPITLDLALTTPQVVSAGNLTLQLSSALGIEDVVMPQSFGATANGNARDNTFIFLNRPAGPAVTDTISGKVGMDTLDFSALTAGVTVNLGNHNSTQAVGGGYNLSLPAEDMETVAGSATGANSLTGNSLNGLVIGGAGNDTLVGGSGNEILIGNASDDTLTGGSGNDLLIGGTGGDRLVASNGNNILIAGSTAYDFLGYDPAKAQILTGILAEWNNAAETFDTRHAAIAGQAGSGHLNGGFYLNSTTVFSDTNVDTLTSSSGTNWFFVDNTANNNTPVDIITGTTKKNPYFTYI